MHELTQPVNSIPTGRPNLGRLKLPGGWRLHALVFTVGFAIVVLRRPDAVLNAQFWAEDGAVWYVQAYNLGIRQSLLLPHSGYYQTISRLTAAMAQGAPLLWAPLIFNIVAITVKVLPVNLMISSRFSTLIPSLAARIFVSSLYLALPNSWEIHANLTNAQWYLALLASMIVLATPSDRLAWRAFDVGIVLLSALSGLFCILLVPAAALCWWLRRHPWRLLLLAVIGAGALIQTASISATAHATRAQMPLGATPELFATILGGQVFLGSVIGQQGYDWIVSAWGQSSLVISWVALIGLAAVVHALLKAPVELRLFVVFAAMILGASLAAPDASWTVPQWQVLWLPGVGGRYWFVPMLAFLSVLVWMHRGAESRWLRIFASLVLGLMVIGITLDWNHPRFTDFGFSQHAHRLETSAEGSEVEIPINPPGWSMTLMKH